MFSLLFRISRVVFYSNCIMPKCYSAAAKHNQYKKTSRKTKRFFCCMVVSSLMTINMMTSLLFTMPLCNIDGKKRQNLCKPHYDDKRTINVIMLLPCRRHLHSCTLIFLPLFIFKKLSRPTTDLVFHLRPLT